MSTGSGSNLKSQDIGLLTATYNSNSGRKAFLINIQDVIIYGIIFLFFYILLRRLLAYAKYKMELPNFSLKLEEFYKHYGYTYEFAFVFSVLTNEEKASLSAYQLKYSMKNIIDRLQNAGLETKLFYSCQRDEIYVKVRAKHERLLKQADIDNYKLRIDAIKLRTRLASGKKDDDASFDLNGGYKWQPVMIEDEFHISSIEPYDYIYGEYREREDLQTLYCTYPTPLGNLLMLREVDRIKLLISIIEGEVSQSPPGAGLQIGELRLNKAVLAGYPIHNFDELENLQLNWLGLTKYHQPLDQIKDYFGERIGFYFAYLEHYVHALFYPTVGGLITFGAQVLQQTDQGTLQPWYTLLMVVWNTLFIEDWKQKQAYIAMKWGVDGYEEEEITRSQYQDDKKLDRKVIVMLVLLSFLVSMIFIVAGIYVIQEYLFGPAPAVKSALLLGEGFNGVVFLTAVAQALLIIFFDSFYMKIMVALNDYENHRTQTEYEDNLVTKVFAFKIVNNYAALIYAAFFKAFLSGYFCNQNSCVLDLADTLRVLFLFNLLSNVFNEVFLRLYKQSRKNKRESAGVEPGKIQSPIELQYILAEYDVLLDTANDYAALVTQYGFMILFVAVFPVGPALAFAASFIKVRIDGWKLCQATRRPQPQTNEDIGVWLDMLEIVSVLAVLFNMALLIFIADYLVEYSWRFRWVIFMIAEHMLFSVKFVLSILIDDVPEEVEIQVARKAFMVSKAINDVADEIDPEYQSQGLSKAIFIANTDYEWFGMEDTSTATAASNDEMMRKAAMMSDEESKSAEGASIEMKNIYSAPAEPSVPMHP